MCVGFMYVMYVNAWFEKHNRLFPATVTSAPTILAILQNQVITEHANPINLVAHTDISYRNYFSHAEILDRVPRVIAVLGAMTQGILVTEYFLLSSPDPIPSGVFPEAKIDDHQVLACNKESEQLDARATESYNMNVKNSRIGDMETTLYKSNSTDQKDSKDATFVYRKLKSAHLNDSSLQKARQKATREKSLLISTNL
ncbi:hypothetical protein PoB_001704900 [Plakobranchus ocellatus]|uniref:Uncharacterized protein n=1 Tax=Plakobranchus ocellatus TaxID=259542 RepID=A0AAV3Z833_9GAST|nr:hypothetical protein PoB_001704900 [Plakobranchus ocellatus]